MQFGKFTRSFESMKEMTKNMENLKELKMKKMNNLIILDENKECFLKNLDQKMKEMVLKFEEIGNEMKDKINKESSMIKKDISLQIHQMNGLFPFSLFQINTIS